MGLVKVTCSLNFWPHHSTKVLLFDELDSLDEMFYYYWVVTPVCLAMLFWQIPPSVCPKPVLCLYTRMDCIITLLHILVVRYHSSFSAPPPLQKKSNGNLLAGALNTRRENLRLRNRRSSSCRGPARPSWQYLRLAKWLLWPSLPLHCIPWPAILITRHYRQHNPAGFCYRTCCLRRHCWRSDHHHFWKFIV